MKVMKLSTQNICLKFESTGLLKLTEFEEKIKIILRLEIKNDTLFLSLKPNHCQQGFSLL